MRKLIWLAIVLLFITSGCQRTSSGKGTDSGSAGANVPTGFRLNLVEAPANLGQLKMNLNQLGPFHARFVLEFEGQKPWVYQVDTRSDGTNIEYQLSVQGLDEKLDLGDVRLVNSFGHNFMSGSGTGDICFQFPDSFETETLFLGPTEFIHLSELSSLPEESGRETILGREATHYTSPPEFHRGWQDVSVAFWFDSQTEAVLKYEFFASGNDPLYYQGQGKLHGVFEVLEIGPQQIQAIPNCVIDFPIPDGAADLIRFPGLIAFNTTLHPAALDEFYTRALGRDGWAREEPQSNPQTQDQVFEYTSQNRSVIIHLVPLNLEDISQGFKVEIYLDE